MPPRHLRTHPFGFRICDRAPRMKRLAAALIAVPGLMPSISNAQLSGAAAEPQQIDVPWGLRLAPQIEEHPLAPGSAPSTFVLGDQASGTADRDMAAKGAAEVRRGVSVVKGDALHYDQDTDMADAYGHVRISTNGAVFYGPEAHMQVESSQGFMPVPKYHFTTRGGSGSAKEVKLLDSERSVFTDATYTACQCETRPAWYIRGSKFEFDTGQDEGVARNGVLFFQGVPIFASPWLSFPLSNERKSGLLPPTFSFGSTNGFDFSQPYYFNIAPNRDLTVTGRYIERRGVQLQQQFRYLSPSYSGTFYTDYLPNDAAAHRNRYAIFWQHNQNLGNGFGFYVNYNKVSDINYPYQLGSAGNQYTVGAQLVYAQEAGFTYNSGPWSVLLREQHWLSFDPGATPYGREPQLNVKYTRYNVGGFDFGAEADATRFTIPVSNSTQGDRFAFNPYVSYGIYAPGYFIVPKVQAHVAAYNLTNIGTDVPAGEPKNFTEAVPTYSFDSGLIFERSVRLFGGDYIQTLEPRLYYVYSPYRNQNRAPLFDTAPIDFGLAEMFMPNTFVGNDRVADANRVTTALTTRFIDAATGDERARFVIAQQYNFVNQRVLVSTTNVQPGTKGSNVIAGGSLKIGAGFSTQAAVQYNAEQSQFVQAITGFGFSPADRKVINMSYQYTRADLALNNNEPINQLLISGEWPITRRIFAVGRIEYDLADKRVVDGLVGFQYDADCWGFGIGLQRYVNGITASGVPSSGTRVLAQLTLKGLSHVDNGLTAAFRAGVEGYQPPPPPAPPLSRFSDYE
ncbi:LPS-assembly protein LptD [Trinickia symbiotica]|uniref:LPS-assembly protein LptD n=1 Tax=Trinickia symbiotica TaxID=863227 RepID=A0A2N7X3M4_9BURK|nr:LPS-assembly protein LptD [Trinickia symbiotica]PMS36349.1 LPS-assembly protein LptD [Trinickia symbiotica]